jgi:hypothetical protein
MKYTATRLRQNLYQILDDIVDKGIPVEVERKGRILKIVPNEPVRKLDNLKAHQTIVGKPESLLKLNWKGVWKEGQKL